MPNPGLIPAPTERTMDGYYERTQITGFQNGQAQYRGTVATGQNVEQAKTALAAAYANGSEGSAKALVSNGTLTEVTLYDRRLDGARVYVRFGRSSEHGVQTTYRMSAETFASHDQSMIQRIRDEKGKFRVETLKALNDESLVCHADARTIVGHLHARLPVL